MLSLQRARHDHRLIGPFLTSCARTDVGRAREKNEDAFVLVDLAAPNASIACEGERVDIGTRRMLLALSDGMGGHSAGEVASSLALTTLVRELATTLPPDNTDLGHHLDAAVQAANTAVRVAAEARERRGMGATLTAVLIADGVAWIAEVGDSRAYLLRSGKLCQLTRDQSFVQMLVDTGAMTEEEARHSSRRNVILQAIGTDTSLHVALGRLDLRRGDRLLLCSDGLSNEVEYADSRPPLARGPRRRVRARDRPRQPARWSRQHHHDRRRPRRQRPPRRPAGRADQGDAPRDPGVPLRPRRRDHAAWLMLSRDYDGAQFRWLTR